MAEVKQVKVNNWALFFLQRLKSFFNRTDHCDLTLQFQDNAQLKVHRLVLSTCTKYFEVLERTCEMYDNCLIMPDYLQADVVVPIINFMYTGQLEYEYNLYDRLHSTALLMSMNVLVKLLDAQKASLPERTEPVKKEMILMNTQLANRSAAANRSTGDEFHFEKSHIAPSRKYGPASRFRNDGSSKASSISEIDVARPTRYELPEGLDNDDLLETSFADISYESLPIIKPLKRENTTAVNIYDEASTSRRFEELKRGVSYKRPRLSPESHESKRIDLEQVNEYAYQQKLRSEYASRDDYDDDVSDSFQPEYKRSPSTAPQKKTSDNLFSHISKYGITPKEAPKSSEKSNILLNHAKIISEVLKKYPHLVKTNKNIKLKIMTDKETNSSQSYVFESNKKSYVPSFESNKKSYNSPTNAPMSKGLSSDWTYVPRNANAEAMANLVALGVENTTGPWLCLLCGTSTKALKFFTYNKYYRHLIDHHKEKLHPKICEYCGFKSGKRNHLLHHMYTKHDIPPPPNYHFPKCNVCSYVALTEAFLIKHKLSHMDSKDFTCSVCNCAYRTRPQLLNHIHTSGHKISPDRRISTKCVYCNKVFLREANLYTHLKLAHKELARSDGIIDNSDEDDEDNKYVQNVSYEFGSDPQEEEYLEIKDEHNGKILIPQKLINNELYSKNRKRVDEYEMTEKEYNTMEPMHIMETEEQSKAESTESMGRSISSSINLVDVVVLNENEYIIPDSNSQRTECKSDNVVLSNAIEQQSLNVNAQSKVLKINTMNPTQKLGQSIQNLINSSPNQPVHIVISGNQQYKVVTSAPQVYANTTKTVSGVVDSVKSEQSKVSEQVVMMNEEDFQAACSQSNSDSNILVMCSQNEEDSKQFLQDNLQQYDSNSQEIEAHMEQIHAETEDQQVVAEQDLVHETVEQDLEHETIEEQDVVHETVEQDLVHETVEQDLVHETVEQDLVHETVEHWQEETVENVSLEAKEIDEEHLQTCVTEESQNSIGEDKIEYMLESNETEHIIQEHPDMPSETAEVIVTSNDTEKQEDLIEHLGENINGIVESTNNSVEECESELTIQDESPMETEECIEMNDSHNYALQSKDSDVQDGIAHNMECVEKKIAENEYLTENLILEDSMTTNASMSTEVEESIENIEEEIKKQNQGQMCEQDSKEEDANVNNNETICADNDKEDVDVSMEEIISEEQTESEVKTDGNDLSPIITKNNKDEVLHAEKTKTVEEISHLLNEWEDNDSQTEIVDDKDSTSDVGLKDPHIEKLVSDWDEEEEK